MRINIASKEKIADEKLIDFVKWVCEQVIAKQSVKKPGRGEHLIPFDIEIKVRSAQEKDKITPPSVVGRVANKYKAVSTYKEFPNHAHWVIGEPGWQEVAGYVADWLKRV